MNRTRQLALGAVALVVCAAAAHEGRAAAPTAPVPTVSQPTAPPKLGISVGTPVPLRTVNGPIAYSTNTPYEHTFVGKGSRLYAAAMDAQPGGSLSIFTSFDSGAIWTFSVDYPTNLGLATPYSLGCANLAVDAGNPQVVYLTYYANGKFGSMLGFARGQLLGESVYFPPAARRIIAQSGNDLGDLICPDIVSPSPGSVIVADVIDGGNNADSVGTWTSIGDYGASIGFPTQGPTVYATASNTNTAPAPYPCRLASNNGASAPRLFTNGNGTVCVTYAEHSGCTPANTGGRFIECSQDSGAHWTKRKTIDTKGSGAVASLSGAISPSGNVALAWLDGVSGSNEIALAFSNTGGTTWMPGFNYTLPEPFNIMRMYTAATRNAIVPGSTPGQPIVAWENDSALWLGQTIVANSSTLMLDRTTDNGVTWMGAVGAGNYAGTSILSTAVGMVATGYTPGTQSSVILPLSIR